MEQRNYIFSFNEEKCKVGNQRGTLKTFKIEEKLADGSKVCVHTDTELLPIRNGVDCWKL